MKYSANKKSQIEAKYSLEEGQIQNKISEINKSRSENIKDGKNDDFNYQKLLSEYDELKGELTELKDQEDRELAQVERESKTYENENDAEQSAVQTDLDAARQDREAIKESLNQDIEKSFGYFQ